MLHHDDPPELETALSREEKLAGYQGYFLR